MVVDTSVISGDYDQRKVKFKIYFFKCNILFSWSLY